MRAAAAAVPAPKPGPGRWQMKSGRPWSSCHPNRRAIVGSHLCRYCWQVERANQYEGEIRPPRIAGIEQHAAAMLPASCPHCHALPPAWGIGPLYASCMLCGEDAYLASPRVIPLDRALGQPGGRHLLQRKGVPS